MRHAVPAHAYRASVEEISSSHGPVGSDARHAHALTLHGLGATADRQDRHLDVLDPRGPAPGEG